MPKYINQMYLSPITNLLLNKIKVVQIYQYATPWGLNVKVESLETSRKGLSQVVLHDAYHRKYADSRWASDSEVSNLDVRNDK